MSTALSLLFDGISIVLLVAAIIYMAVLNRRLGRLRDTKAELEQVLAGFATAAAKAEASIAQLKALSGEASRLDRQDRDRIDKAVALRDDLAFMLDRGGKLADRLEGAIRGGRERISPAAAAAGEVKPFAPRDEAASPAEPEPQNLASETEQMLLSALRRAR